MHQNISGERVKGSSSYKSAQKSASDYAHDPGKLRDLLDRAAAKAKSQQGRLSEVWESLMACLRLLRAYASGHYKDIPWGSLISIIAAVIYFVMPVDLIPDFLPGLGFIDDAALLGWIVTSVKSDIENFIEWETNQLPPE